MNRLFLILALLPVFGFCQKEIKTVKFIPTFGGTTLEQGKKYYSSKINDSLSIETLRFYVSNLRLLNKGKIVYQAKNHFFLIDLENKTEIKLPAKNVVFDAIQFNVGIDSLTNVSGAMGGDLDPVNGMYWAWQSGYINFKLEGTSNVCATRNHAFQFHIGGYLPPYATLQKVVLPAKNTAEITLDLEKFLNGIDLKKENEVMSPGDKAVVLAKLYQSIFAIKP